jgi:hypothetical protein
MEEAVREGRGKRSGLLLLYHDIPLPFGKERQESDSIFPIYPIFPRYDRFANPLSNRPIGLKANTAFPLLSR